MLDLNTEIEMAVQRKANERVLVKQFVGITCIDTFFDSGISRCYCHGSVITNDKLPLYCSNSH